MKTTLFKPVVLFVVFAIIFGTLGGMSMFVFAEVDTSNPFSGGTGTEDDPYIINTAAQLADLAELLNVRFSGRDWYYKWYKLGNNIDLSEYGENFNGGKGWIPIGNLKSEWFNGDFDGNNKTITGLYINDPDAAFLSSTGLFGSGWGDVRNLNLVNVNITGNYSVGGIGGSSIHAVNCSVTGNVSGRSNVGGIVGSGWIIENCYADCTVSGNSKVGGIVGYTQYETKNCYSTGTVSGNEHVGGVAGDITCMASVENCYSSSNVSGTKSVGGVAGYVGSSVFTIIDPPPWDGLIKNCYATGAVSGNENVGGVVGEVINYTMNNVALNSSVTGNLRVGRVAGKTGLSSLSKNRALNGMTVMLNNAPKNPLSVYHDKVDGANIEAGDAVTTSFWKDVMGWSEEIWYFEDGRYPILKSLITTTSKAVRTNNNIAVIVNTNSDIPNDYIIKIALYSNGRLVNYTSDMLSTVQYHIAFFKDVKNADSAKIFIWKADMTPVSVSEKIPID